VAAAIEQVAQLSAQLLLQSALEAEVGWRGFTMTPRRAAAAPPSHSAAARLQRNAPPHEGAAMPENFNAVA